MRKMLTHWVTKTVAWVTILATATTIGPAQAFAANACLGHQPKRPTQSVTPEVQKRLIRNRTEKPSVRPLSRSEMRDIQGSGYRQPAFCGTAGWQRDFHGVNLCTGNLMKSFTDVQVSPARGTGLVLQRTYNSNDGRVGSFGLGWTHAYDIRMEDTGNNKSEYTDFLGGKHAYTRDADGLYTPPAYMHSNLFSVYDSDVEIQPQDISEDTQVGLDGGVKHFFRDGTERICDYMEDRHGNRTTLSYEDHVTAGGMRKFLHTVMDPSGRQLIFTWNDVDPGAGYAWRITRVDGPRYSVAYSYYTSGAPGRLYNLQSVTLDPHVVANDTHLNRTTTFDYTSVTGPDGTMESGLLAEIVDPLGNPSVYSRKHRVSYQYYVPNDGNGNPIGTGTVWVSRIYEPAGTVGNEELAQVWQISNGNLQPQIHAGCSFGTTVDDVNGPLFLNMGSDYDSGYIRARCFFTDVNTTMYYTLYESKTNNLLSKSTHHYCEGVMGRRGIPNEVSTIGRIDTYSYGPHGHMLTHNITGFPGTDTYEYWDIDKYFQKKKVTDMNGKVTTFDYGTDADTTPIGERGELLWARDAKHQTSGPAYTYAYNQYGQRIGETNYNGITTTCTYGDQWGNLTQVVQDPGTSPHLNRTTSMVYNAAGQVTSKTDPMGRTSTISYNVLGQPDTATFPAPNPETVVYSYDANGRTGSVTDARGTTSMAYEPGSDRVSSVTDPVTGTISYTYTLAGSVRTKTLPGSTTPWEFTYLSNGWSLSSDDPNSLSENLIQAEDDQGRVVDYYNDWTGFVRSVEYNQTFNDQGARLSYCETQYVLDGQADIYTSAVSRHLLKRVRNLWHQGNNPVVVLSENEYTYDNVGNRLTNTVSIQGQPTRAEQYGYDDIYRLTSVNYGDGETQGYTFDDMDNRLTKTDNVTGNETYGFNAANMLTSRNGGTYTNDLNGNTLTGGGRTNTWDSQNRLRQCVYNGNTSVFTYGADGLRRRSVVNGVTRDFVVDGRTVVRERRNGVNTATYFAGLYRRDDTTGQLCWYVYDGLGSVLAEVNPQGAITASRKYDVYGLVRSGDAGTSNHKFVGQLGHPSEGETGLIYMQARYVDPAVGRFLSEDPARDGLNWYAYSGSSPTNLVDPDGKASTRAVAALLAAVWAVLFGVNSSFELPPLVKDVLSAIECFSASAASVLATAEAAAMVDSVRNPTDRLTYAAVTVLTGVTALLSYRLAIQNVRAALLIIDPDGEVFGIQYM